MIRYSLLVRTVEWAGICDILQCTSLNYGPCMKVAVICGNLLVLIMDCPGGCDMWQFIDMKAVICGNVLTSIMDCTGGCDM